MDFSLVRSAASTTGCHTVPVREWVEGSPFSAALGVELVESTEEGFRLLALHREVNSNPSGVAHGGRAASLATR